MPMWLHHSSGYIRHFTHAISYFIFLQSVENSKHSFLFFSSRASAILYVSRFSSFASAISCRRQTRNPRGEIPFDRQVENGFDVLPAQKCLCGSSSLFFVDCFLQICDRFLWFRRITGKVKNNGEVGITFSI